MKLAKSRRRSALKPVLILKPKLDNNLLAYAAAASAAGVGILALASPAEARVVYTPSNIPIPQNRGLIPLDLNHDGIPDFQFSNYSYQTHGLGRLFLRVVPVQVENEIWDLKSKGHLCAAALPAGKTVGPLGRFEQDPAKGLYLSYIGLGSTHETRFGVWSKVQTAYLGLKFVVKGKTHFGWARIIFAAPGQFYNNPRIAGYAYETIPNTPIKSGQKKGQLRADFSVEERVGLRQPASFPGSLGMLAAGAPALAIWRKEDNPGVSAPISPRI